MDKVQSNLISIRHWLCSEQGWTRDLQKPNPWDE